MAGKPIAHLILATLKRGGRPMHLGEIAEATGIPIESVGSSLGHMVNNNSADVVRVQRGIFKYVGSGGSRGKARSTEEVKVTVAPISPPPVESEEKPSIPEMLEVMGTTSKGLLLARDPDTRQMYEARPM